MRKVCAVCQKILGFMALVASIGFVGGWLMLLGDWFTPPGEPGGLMFFTPDGNVYFELGRNWMTCGACRFTTTADASGRTGIDVTMSPGIVVPYWAILSALCVASACLLFFTPWSKVGNQLTADGPWQTAN